MRPFDLNTALAGEPVKLRNGSKAYVLAKIPDNLKYDKGREVPYPLVGIIMGKDDYISDSHVRWTLKGGCYFTNEPLRNDIVGMWEEPELTQEELFEKALKERLPLRYKGLDEDYADVYVVAKSMSGSYILEWKHDADSCVSILSNLPKFEWYLASKKPDVKITTVGLPKPFTPKRGEKYFSVSPDYVRPEEHYANCLTHPSILNGNCFRTEEDAQKWIDFMKSKKE